MILELVFAFLVDRADAEALRATAPLYLTTDTAAENLTAARIAAAITDTDPDLLLSIAWHESRYESTQVTPEVGGKVSCGAMTPEPTHDRTACRDATSSLVSGYLAGARHLRVWLDASHGNIKTALTGYAGGYRLIAACRRGERVHGCATPDVFLGRAQRIRDRRHRGVS